MTEVRAIIERILRLKAEQDALGEDIREIYAEAKSSGFDKTALGQAVALIRKREKKGADALDELDALVSTYLAAFDGGTEDATRGRVRVREAAPEAST